ncbi:VOC family protein [Paenibacillus sp. UNC451MF]|uniref:VOC family protein n=1 Tax=Paenibacillus sp. UNC451MF TaxID=1449063 RepID=UPI00048B6E2C|nr:VOC family protein [Paenibacillus sp. UNC451MF]
MSYTIHPAMELGEVSLRVSDLKRSLQFYEEVVGFSVLRRSSTIVELTADGKRTLLILEEIPNAAVVPRRSASGLYHFALLLPTRKDLGIVLQRLIQSGIHIGQADHLVSEALYITDPDNHGIEIYRDRPRDTWERDAQGNYKMATDPIDWDGLLNEVKGSTESKLPVGTTMGHVHFHVGDLLSSKHFYCDMLGFDVTSDVMRQMGALFISAGGYHHHIGLNLWAGHGASPPPPNGTGIQYFTIVLPDEIELQKTQEQLASSGITVQRQESALLTQDPSGIGIRFIVK